MFNYVISNLRVLMIFGKNLIIRCLREFVLSHFLVFFSQLVTSTNRFCRIVMDLTINIAYFPFQVNGIKVSLPNKDGSSNIEISRSGSYVTAFSFVIRPYEINHMHIFKGSVFPKIVSWLYLNLQIQSLPFYP
jgi:hypothetical protein